MWVIKIVIIFNLNFNVVNIIRREILIIIFGIISGRIFIFFKYFLFLKLNYFKVIVLKVFIIVEIRDEIRVINIL